MSHYGKRFSIQEKASAMNDTPNSDYPDNSANNQTVNTPYTTVESESKSRVEEFSVSGDTLLNKIQELVQQGNIRKIVVKTQDSKTLFELPLTVGILGGTIGSIFFPFAAILAGVGVLAAKLTIVVEKDI